MTDADYADQLAVLENTPVQIKPQLQAARSISFHVNQSLCV